MPVAVAAAAASGAGAGAGAGGGAAAGSAASGAAAGGGTATGSAAGGTAAGAGAGAGAGGGAAAGSAGGSAGGAAAAADKARKAAQIGKKAEEKISKAGRKKVSFNPNGLRKNKKEGKDQNREDEKTDKSIMGSFLVGAILLPIICFLLILVVIVTFIFSGPLGVTYPAFKFEGGDIEDLDGIYSYVSSNYDLSLTEDSTNGDALAQKIVKYYQADYDKIYSLGPNEIIYLHDYSNLRDIMYVYSTLAQTDLEASDTPSYISDVDDNDSNQNIFDKIIHLVTTGIRYIANWIHTTRQQTALLKNVYNEMFYYTVHRSVTKSGTFITVNIYNKDVNDYIDEHPELTTEERTLLEIAGSHEYDWSTWDSSEYDAIAYQGTMGYNNGYYNGGAGGNVYYIDSGSIYKDGYGTKTLPSDKQAFVNMVAQVAIANYKKSGILPSVAVAQACYESQYGTSVNAKLRNNISGVKDHGKNKVFSSIDECMNYYFSKSLILNARYDKARGQKTPEATLQAILDAHYCVGDSTYLSNCMSIINMYGFKYFDDIALGNIEATDVGIKGVLDFCAKMSKKQTHYSQTNRTAYYNSGGKTLTFDCSSFVYYAYKAGGIQLGGNDAWPMSSSEQYKYLQSKGCEISKTELQPGDLVFYHHAWDPSRNINHVDIYAGNGMKYNCGTSKGVEYTAFSFETAVGYMRPSKLVTKENKGQKKK